MTCRAKVRLVVRDLPRPLLRAVKQHAQAHGLSTREVVRNALLLMLDMQEAVAALMLRSKVRVLPCVWQLAFPVRDQDDRDAHAQYCPLCRPMDEVPDDVSREGPRHS
jgi:plasmid stability protein